MADLNVNSIGDASGGTTATVNGFTPTVSNMAGRNRIINGDMRIDQRNAGASVAPDNAGVYTLDRWRAWEDTDGSATVQQSTTAPAGFSNSLLWTTTSAAASLGASQYACIGQLVEGFNVADFGWGTASAKSVTLSFWVRSSLTGTFGGSLTNGASTFVAYPFTYTISVANTWEQKTITITGPTSGTWATTTSAGIRLYFGLGVGSTYSGTANAWASGLYFQPTGATSVVGTSGATFYITGVQLEEGSVATPFEHRQYGQELALCQRYFQPLWSNSLNWQGNVLSAYNSNRGFIRAWHKATMRTSPTVTASGFSVGIAQNNTVTNTTTFTAAYSTVDSTSIEIGGSVFNTTYSGHVDINNGCLVVASAEL